MADQSEYIKIGDIPIPEVAGYQVIYKVAYDNNSGGR